jgi:hypothetical protein
MCEGEKKGKNTYARSEARRWVHDVRVNSSLKSDSASQTRDLLLPFIFAMGPCLIRFDRDRHSRLRDDVTLGGSSIYIRAAATEIATYQQSQKYQHI